MTVEEIIERIEAKKYTSDKEIVTWLKTVSYRMPKPEKIKKGDVYTFSDNLSKNRPHVVVKVLKDVVISIPTTTTDDEMAIGNYESRFFGKGYFSKSIIFTKKNIVENKIVGFLENNKAINEAYKLIKDIL